MENLTTWNPDDWTSRESLETMITALGGHALAAAQAEATEARHAHEASLSPGQHALYGQASDAAADASLERENVATRIALLHGLGIGAALAVHGADEKPDLLIGLATNLVTELLASGLRPEVSCRVAATVLRALRLAGLAPVD